MCIKVYITIFTSLGITCRQVTPRFMALTTYITAIIINNNTNNNNTNNNNTNNNKNNNKNLHNPEVCAKKE